MALNDILRLRIHQRMHGGEVLNVLHFVDENGVIGNNAQALADDFRDNMLTSLRGRAGSDMTFEYVEVVKIVPYGDAPVIATWPANTAGTAGGTCQTGTTVEVVTLNTGVIGRRHRGRMYLSGALTSAMSSGSWASTQTTRTQTFATALLARYGGLVPTRTFGLGVWSRLLAGPHPPWPTSAFTRVTTATVRTLIRNQRRRQVGVGR